MKRHVFILSVFHSFINKASCSLGFPSNAVTLKGISRQAIWLPYFILNYLADASNEMRSIVAERQGERARTWQFLWNNNQAVIFFNTIDDLESICNENKQWQGELTPDSFRVHLH